MPIDKSNNHSLLLQIVKDLKKIQLDLQSLREEVSYVKQKTNENNISIVKEEDHSKSWFWSG